MGQASITITLDIYGHLFNDSDFNRQQAELLEHSFKSVRKNPHFGNSGSCESLTGEALKTIPAIERLKYNKKSLHFCRPLILFGGGERI
jgi:hypothetical protein